jgi:hypothetical protein
MESTTLNTTFSHLGASSLCQYLQIKFPPSSEKNFEEAGKEIEQYFWDTYKVYVTFENPFFNFKYAQRYYILCRKPTESLCERWDVAAVQECRGIILHRDPNLCKWSVASRPFDKFFNQVSQILKTHY